ncbi:hypothetical protein [Methanosarcina horonobensis]|uniref:hypothetical protein n=2 Tax=Methanosarcina horonobensis TaxID=418008 RepID=UPI0022B8CE72|nr:hypothetical protein [Methanosarcina horonobensis]
MRQDEMVSTKVYLSWNDSLLAASDNQSQGDTIQNIKKIEELCEWGTIWDFFDQDKADVLFITAEEGYTMTLVHPFYDVAIFEPNGSYKVLYAYPVSKNSSGNFLLLLNYWIKMERDYGELDRKYNYWILRKNPEESEPRWSVVRNVLYWVN